jgi:hypothetical protein
VPAKCPECGAPVTEPEGCLANFYALLALESRVPGGPGEAPHFHAVASYVLQHPDSMKYTEESLTGLRRNLTDQLDGTRSLEQTRTITRRAVNGSQRVTRREGDRVVRWPVTAWPMTVTDVLTQGTEGYIQRVRVWAESVLTTLQDGTGRQ